VVIESSSPYPFLVLIRYISDIGQRLVIVNLHDDVRSSMNDPLLAPPPRSRWDLVWSSDHPDYGGSGSLPFVHDGPWLLRGHSTIVVAAVSIAESRENSAASSRFHG
jgi:maltooligosyltrehalose trehalohydrolase